LGIGNLTTVRQPGDLSSLRQPGDLCHLRHPGDLVNVRQSGDLFYVTVTVLRHRGDFGHPLRPLSQGI